MNRSRLIPMLSLVTALALPACADAAVYKCMVDGRLVYSDRRCEADSAPINAAPAMRNGSAGGHRSSSTYSRGYGNRRNDSGGGSKAAVIDRSDPAKRALCDEVKRRRDAAERNGGAYRGNTAEELDELEFSRCFGHVNGAQ